MVTCPIAGFVPGCGRDGAGQRFVCALNAVSLPDSLSFVSLSWFLVIPAAVILRQILRNLSVTHLWDRKE